MLKVETKCELEDGRVLHEGEVILTVDTVQGGTVTGWFRPDWWDTNIARALVLATPCEYGDDETQNEEWSNPLNCKCATCLIAEFPYDDHGWHGEPAELTVTLSETTLKEGEVIVLRGLFTSERLTGADDRHGVTAGGSSTTYCGSTSWTEWEVLEAQPLAK